MRDSHKFPVLICQERSRGHQHSPTYTHVMCVSIHTIYILLCECVYMYFNLITGVKEWRKMPFTVLKSGPIIICFTKEETELQSLNNIFKVTTLKSQDLNPGRGGSELHLTV